MTLDKKVFSFIKDLNKFEHRLDFVDLIWEIIFPDKKNKWHHIQITKYHETYYIGLIDGVLDTLEFTPEKQVKLLPASRSSFVHGFNREPETVWNDLIDSAYAWLNHVKKDWIRANSQVQKNYPLNRRMGIVPNSLVRASLTDIYRIDKELGKTKTKKFINLVESGYFRDEKNFTRLSMTANDFFKYCKIAYIAAQRKDDTIDENLSGKELYERYADGRDEGLLEINSASKKEFADWIDGVHPKKTSGGHPWEIKRGGNTTHIDLYVTRPKYSFKEKEGFEVTLRGASIGRLKETICMFLAIYEAGLPITIVDPEGIRKRLLALDNIGIIPCYDSLHRANQSFREDEAVFDVIHFDDLGRFKQRIKPFITWEALPILIPKSVL